MNVVKTTRDHRPGELIVRSGAIALLSAATNVRPAEIRKRWGADVGLDLVAKAAASVGSVDAYGAALLAEQAEGFFDLLASQSVLAALGQVGTRIQFRGRDTVGLNERTSTSRAATAFIGEGAPVPASALSFARTSLARYKAQAMAIATAELLDSTVSEVEAFVEAALVLDLARAIDVALLDATEGDASRPAGLLFDTTPTASAGTTVANIDVDLGALLAEFEGVETSELRLVLHPARRRSLSLKRGSGGSAAYPELASGRLAGVEVIESANCPDDAVLLVRARELAVGFDGPVIQSAQDVILHMDTSPAAIGTAGSPNVVSAPVTSAWQSELSAIRCTMPIGWAMRSAGAVASLSGVAW